jgi:DNA-binding transcriptional MerR regulator
MGAERGPETTYSVREASELVGLSARQIRSLITEDIIHPDRSHRGRYRLSFADVVLLRAIASLAGDGVPMARIRSTVKRLREQVADDTDLTAASLDASGRTIVVTIGEDTWEPESGQRVLDLGIAGERAAVVAVPRRSEPTIADATASDWYAYADQIEAVDAGGAEAAYRRALALDPSFAEAHVDLGRLLHAGGAVSEALEHYERAHELDPTDATTLFNLGVAYDDLRRDDEAVSAYRRALDLAPRFADARFNLATVYERMGQVSLAVQELRAYRDLLAGR